LHLKALHFLAFLASEFFVSTYFSAFSRKDSPRSYGDTEKKRQEKEILSNLKLPNPPMVFRPIDLAISDLIKQSVIIFFPCHYCAKSMHVCQTWLISTCCSRCSRKKITLFSLWSQNPVGSQVERVSRPAQKGPAFALRGYGEQAKLAERSFGKPRY